MILAPLPFSLTLSERDLGAFLDRIGSPSPISLRRDMPDGDTLSEDGLAALTAAQLMGRTSDGANAVPSIPGRTLGEVLLNPGTNIDLEIWGRQPDTGRMTVIFPNRPAAGAGVIVNRIKGRYQLAGFADADTLVEIATDLLPPDPLVAVPDFEAVLDSEQATVLSAMIDRLAGERFDLLQRLIARGEPETDATIPLSPFSARDIHVHLDIWWGASRRESLLGQLFTLILRADFPSEERCRMQLEALAEAGLLQRDDRQRYAATELLEPVVAAACGVIGGLAWDRVTRQAEEEVLLGAARRFLIAENGIVFDLELAGENRIRITVSGAGRVRRFLASEIAGGGAYRPPAAKQETAPPAISAEAAVEPENRPAVPHNFCEQCGNRLSPGDKFCTACGARVGGE